MRDLQAGRDVGELTHQSQTLVTAFLQRHPAEKGYEVPTGVGADLMAGARDAVSGLIDLLTARHGMTPEEAYMLCSVCADLRISEIVDQPNWIVSFYFPRLVLE